MKKLLFGVVLFASTFALAQTSSIVPFNGFAGIIITPNGTEALTDSEMSTLLYASYSAKLFGDGHQDQANQLLTGAASIVANAHHVDPGAPFQIVLDMSLTFSFQPAWTTVAQEGDTITVKAGTTLRYGAAAGTPCGDAPSCDTTPLAADTFTTFTVTQDTTFIVGQAPTPQDPIYGYKKVIQVLGSTASVTKPPTT